MSLLSTVDSIPIYIDFIDQICQNLKSRLFDSLRAFSISWLYFKLLLLYWFREPLFPTHIILVFLCYEGQSSPLMAPRDDLKLLLEKLGYTHDDTSNRIQIIADFDLDYTDINGVTQPVQRVAPTLFDIKQVMTSTARGLTDDDSLVAFFGVHTAQSAVSRLPEERVNLDPLYDDFPDIPMIDPTVPDPSDVQRLNARDPPVPYPESSPGAAAPSENQFRSQQSHVTSNAKDGIQNASTGGLQLDENNVVACLDLRGWLCEDVRPGARITVVADTCDGENIFDLPLKFYRENGKLNMEEMANDENLPGNLVVISATRSGQKAHSLTIKETGTTHGVLTWHLLGIFDHFPQYAIADLLQILDYQNLQGPFQQTPVITTTRSASKYICLVG